MTLVHQQLKLMKSRLTTHACHSPRLPSRMIHSAGSSSKLNNQSNRDTRKEYGYLLPIQTRWMDNDVYGHVNNVVYYSFFDTVVNKFLIEKCGLDIEKGEVIGLVRETKCLYHAPITFPQTIEAAIRVATIGNTSVKYEVGIFNEGEDLSVANGHFVHVYVDRHTRKPVQVPTNLRTELTRIQMPAPTAKL